jgi:hypothetical protein
MFVGTSLLFLYTDDFSFWEHCFYFHLFDNTCDRRISILNLVSGPGLTLHWNVVMLCNGHQLLLDNFNNFIFASVRHSFS